MKPNKAISMIGLAMRAGKVVSGEFAAEKAVKTKKASLVIVATDASDNTKKLFTNGCQYYHIPLVFYGTKKELGRILGKDIRASIAILDQGFGEQIQKHIEAQNQMEV